MTTDGIDPAPATSPPDDVAGSCVALHVRMTARAVTLDTRVGAARAKTRTTKDLILRLATPRFLTEGDEVDVPAIVHNYLPDDQRVSLGVAATGVTAGGPTGPRVADVASGGEDRSDWRFLAERPGTATFTGEAIAPGESDAVELSLPVLPYGLARAATAAGTLYDAAEQAASLEIPAASNPAARTIRVALAPSLGGALLGGVFAGGPARIAGERPARWRWWRDALLLAAVGLVPDLDFVLGAHSTYTHSVGAVVSGPPASSASASSVARLQASVALISMSSEVP